MQLQLLNPTKYSITARWEMPEGLKASEYELQYVHVPENTDVNSEIDQNDQVR